jgi:hypothetical protein
MKEEKLEKNLGKLEYRNEEQKKEHATENYLNL